MKLFVTKLYNTKVEQQIKEFGYTIQDLGLAGRPADIYKGMNWWNITYSHKSFSIYFDAHEAMASVGEPYYEIYDGNDVERFLVTDGNDYQDNGFRLVRYLRSRMDDFKLDQQNNPENWLWKKSKK